jgi:L-seryl-tRNA(Ser) seleniumtransferase
VVPGASAGIALAVAACIARGDGPLSERLPHADAVVLAQRGHEYKYARCAALAGARVEFTDDIAGALARGPAAILHPAHLNHIGLGIEALTPLARSAGVPIVVDAAFQSFPLDALARWSRRGDVACFSAKYFWGPNSGGFVAGASGLVADIAALDFVGYESGPWRTFGRAFKLDRATVAATVAALGEWVALDHAARLADNAARAQALAARCGGTLKHFTLDEQLVDGPVNAVVFPGAGARAGPLAAGDPSVRAIVAGDALVLCTETLTDSDVAEIVAAWERLDDG